MAGPKQARSREISGKVRQAFLKAVDKLKTQGTIEDLSDLWVDMIAQDPFRAFELLARYIPKEHLVETESTLRVISGDPLTAEQWEREYLEGPPIEERKH